MSDKLYGGYSTHPLPTRHAESKKERNVPKYVQEKAEEIEAQGKPPEYAFPVAWSIYCKYKNTSSDHCKMKKDEYFPNRKKKKKASAVRVASRYMRGNLP